MKLWQNVERFKTSRKLNKDISNKNIM